MLALRASFSNNLTQQLDKYKELLEINGPYHELTTPPSVTEIGDSLNHIKPTSDSTKVQIFSLDYNCYFQLYVYSNRDGFHSGITHGMMGEGLLEVVYRSVNGGAVPGSPEGCINHLKEKAKEFVESMDTPKGQQDWLLYLDNLSCYIDGEFESYL